MANVVTNDYGRRLILLLTVALAFAGCASSQEAEAVAKIRQYHVVANEPSANEFDRLLKRDVISHLSSLGFKGDTLKVDLLRKGATQSGISYPKYYAWVLLKKGKATVVEGAVRVAAVEKDHFGVTDFCSLHQLNTYSSLAAEVFPKALVPEIEKRVKARIRPIK